MDKLRYKCTVKIEQQHYNIIYFGRRCNASQKSVGNVNLCISFYGKKINIKLKRYNKFSARMSFSNNIVKMRKNLDAVNIPVKIYENDLYACQLYKMFQIGTLICTLYPFTLHLQKIKF